MKRLRSSHSSGYLRPMTIGALALAAVSVLLVKCAGSGGGGSQPAIPVDDQPVHAPFKELTEQGVTKYLGIYTPMKVESEGGVDILYFGAGDGPLCFDGSEYLVSLRDSGSEDLLIYLQPGGACWSEICRCAEYALPGIPRVGILNPDDPENPVKGWSTSYLSYCDGSHFAGDVDLDSDGDGLMDRHHRGLKNLSAGLDATLNAFPAPRRILLAGTSAGGFGAMYALPLVRAVYPDAYIYLLNDSGIGIMPPGDIAQMLSDWEATGFIPKSCPDCLDEQGCLTKYYSWLLSEDPRLKIGFMSYTKDTVIADDYSSMGGDDFKSHLLEDFALLEEAHPGRVHSFVVEGSLHGLLGYMGTSAGTMTVAEWLGLMLEDSPEWESVGTEGVVPTENNWHEMPNYQAR